MNTKCCLRKGGTGPTGERGGKLREERPKSSVEKKCREAIVIIKKLAIGSVGGNWDGAQEYRKEQIP